MPSWANAHVAPRAGDCVGPGLAHEEHEPFFGQFNGKQKEILKETERNRKETEKKQHEPSNLRELSPANPG